MAHFPNKTDLAFYQARRLPKWARLITRLEDPPAPSIDAVVSAHVWPDRLDTETHNLCAMVRHWRKRGGLRLVVEMLASFELEPKISRKRRALARKWRRRLEIDRA